MCRFRSEIPEADSRRKTQELQIGGYGSDKISSPAGWQARIVIDKIAVIGSRTPYSAGNDHRQSRLLAPY
jgi:hypothetical protein